MPGSAQAFLLVFQRPNHVCPHARQVPKPIYILFPSPLFLWVLGSQNMWQKWILTVTRKRNSYSDPSKTMGGDQNNGNVSLQSSCKFLKFCLVNTIN